MLTQLTDIGGKYHLEYASTILCRLFLTLHEIRPKILTILVCISFLLVIAVYVIYWYGPTLRKRSPFAQQLSDAKAELQTHGGPGRLSRVPTSSRANSFARSQQNLRIRQTMGSRQNSFAASRPTSRNASARQSFSAEV